MAEHWRVGRHVPHHVYRSDGGTVDDEVAVTHRPEDAAQIVADHNLMERYRAALERIRDEHSDTCYGCGECSNCEARQALAEDGDAD